MQQQALNFEDVGGGTERKSVRTKRTSSPRRDKKKIHFWVEIIRVQDVPKGWDAVQNTWAFSEAQAEMFVRRRINRAFRRDEHLPVPLKVLVKH